MTFFYPSAILIISTTSLEKWIFFIVKSNMVFKSIIWIAQSSLISLDDFQKFLYIKQYHN